MPQPSLQCQSSLSCNKGDEQRWAFTPECSLKIGVSLTCDLLDTSLISSLLHSKGGLTAASLGHNALELLRQQVYNSSMHLELQDVCKPYMSSGCVCHTWLLSSMAQKKNLRPVLLRMASSPTNSVLTCVLEVHYDKVSRTTCAAQSVPCSKAHLEYSSSSSPPSWRASTK